MAAFGTIDVYNELAHALNASEQWQDVGKDLTYRIAFRYTDPINTNFVLRFDQGRVTEVEELAASDDQPLDYTISASPKTWKGILEGRKNPMVAITTGKLKIEGDTVALLKHMSAFSAVLEAMSAVELT